MNLRRFRRDEEGQAIVQVSIALVVLLGFVSLAIDVGNVYSERRRMQNAADAGALAGARQLCMGNDATAAEAEAQRYMMENGVVTVEAGDITITDDYLVETIARKTADTYIAGVLGVTDVDVAAEAAAACGAVTSGCGLWPIAFELGQWQEINPDGVNCTPQQFAVWNDGTEVSCWLPSDPLDATSPLEEHEQICDCYDCDPDDDGDSFSVITELSRGWMDYSGAVTEIYTDECTASGCGAAELGCQFANDSGARIELPTCIAGERGVRASIRADVESRVTDVVGIPLFDSINCTVEGGNNCSGTEASTYHVTRIGCVTVDGWDQNLDLDPLPDAAPFNPILRNIKAIMVSVHCDGCFTSCGSTDGTPPEPWEMRAVSLIR